MTDLTGFAEFGEFNRQLVRYGTKHAYRAFFRFEAGKDLVAGALYHKRGKYASPFLHSAMMAFLFFGLTFGPRFVQSGLAEENLLKNGSGTGGQVLGVSLNDTGLVTLESDKPRSQITDYVVKDGDSLSSIAAKFDVSVDTIKWANPDANWKNIKIGTTVHVPPVTGVVYKVKPGDTVYSIAKTLQADSQTIVDFPFNTFSDDETFALVAGQTLIVPNGIMPDGSASTPHFTALLTPDAGSVSGTGSFVWPTHGTITQFYSWFHKANDIANAVGTPVVAADSGVVITAGWDNSGYGNHIMIDHGNGYITLYAHLSAYSIQLGQHVSRGTQIGLIGSTGHSTGSHLHFEIRHNGVLENPLTYLK